MLDLEKTAFGIEFETCICANEGPLLLEKMPVRYRNTASALYTNRLVEIAKEKGIVVNIRYEPNPRATDYNSWTVTKDASIECVFRNFLKANETDKYYIAGKSTDVRCEHFSTSAEIVTPTYKYSSEGYEHFSTVLEQVMFVPEFTYTSNISQNMHINVSHPEQNFLKTLEMWWYFEDVIILFSPVGLRGSYYVRSLRNIFPTIENLRAKYLDFYANPDKPPAKYTALCKKENRFEFRLVPAKMSMDHILSWLGFCVRFVASSTSFEKPIDSDAGTFDELFAHIQNDAIKEYFRSAMIEHNNEDFKQASVIAGNIKKGMPLSAFTEEAFTKVCKYNLLSLDILFNKLLEQGNLVLLKVLVNITSENQDIVLNLRKIIDNWDTLSKYKDILLAARTELNSTAYDVVVSKLSGEPYIVGFIPHHYAKTIEYLDHIESR